MDALRKVRRGLGWRQVFGRHTNLCRTHPGQPDTSRLDSRRWRRMGFLAKLVRKSRVRFLRLRQTRRYIHRDHLWRSRSGARDQRQTDHLDRKVRRQLPLWTDSRSVLSAFLIAIFCARCTRSTPRNDYTMSALRSAPCHIFKGRFEELTFSASLLLLRAYFRFRRIAAIAGLA